MNPFASLKPTRGGSTEGDSGKGPLPKKDVIYTYIYIYRERETYRYHILFIYMYIYVYTCIIHIHIYCELVPKSSSRAGVPSAAS